MNYTSIVVFLDYCGIDVESNDSLNISRIKKQINAEFSMAAEGIITINNVVYNKQDILNILEAPHVLDTINFHQKIDSYPNLKKILETGIAEDDLENVVLIEKSNDDFIKYLSPFFAPVFNREMKKRLKSNDFEHAANWIPACQLILNTDAEIAFQSASEHLEETIRLFRNLNKTTFLSRKEEVKPWIGNWARYLNWLPDILFLEKEVLAIKLINFCVEIQYVDPNYCYLISKQQIQLNFLDQQNTALILDNHRIYESKVSDKLLIPADRRAIYKKEKSKGKNIIIVIVLLIFAIVRLVNTCNNSSSDSNSYNYSTYEKYTDKDELLIVENAVKKLQKARSESPKSISKIDNKNDTFKNDICYISFLNTENTNDDASYTFKIVNQTNSLFSIYVLHDNEMLDLTLIPENSISIDLNAALNQDVILANVNIDLKSIFEKNIDHFYFGLSKKDAFSTLYNDSSLLSINNPNAKNEKVVYLVEENKQLSLKSDSLKLIKHLKM